MTKIAVYPGSFDPFTNGHLDIVQRASGLFDQVVVAAMTNTSKQPLFSSTEKLALIQEATSALPNVRVVALPHELTVRFARRLDAQYLVRGLRSGNDFNYEADIATLNAQLDPEIETVFLLADPRYRNLSSSMVKEVAGFGADISDLVPMNVAAALAAKFGHEHHA